jgi:hypothetical protein
VLGTHDKRAFAVDFGEYTSLVAILDPVEARDRSSVAARLHADIEIAREISRSTVKVIVTRGRAQKACHYIEA